MATGKQGFVGAAVPQHLVSARREGEMHIQAPLAAMYIQAVPGLPPAVQDATVIPLPVPMMCANTTVPFLTLHVSSGAAVPAQRPDATAASPRPKTAGKHVCPHCGRDCLKPSVLEKHLRCHTGERPYPCTTCGISFKTQSNLYKHKRTQAHARLSSESGKGTFSSQESTESSREICSSPSLELPGEDPADVFGTNSGVATPTMPTLNCAQVSTANGRTAAETERALCGAALVGISASTGQQETSNPAGQPVQLSSEGTNEASSVQTESQSRPPTTPNRTPLQRQEALFPKLSRGKTQSHGSTDSGFSEGSETNFTSSPGSTIQDPSMESLAESSMELQETGSSRTSLDEAHGDDKGKVSIQKKQMLEEHILKLISDNSVLVDDKDLVNVRPRKTVLSKQGSIDLPMPYTYKDSFHFEMRSSKHQLSSSPKQDRRDRTIYSSMPMQYSASLEHAPLTRSSSLPFSMGIQTSERTRSPHHGGNVPLSRRCSAGSICTFKSVDPQSPAHRLLVRQAAVDCASGVEVPPMERGSHSSLSSDGDCTDPTSDSSARRCRRKKAQKFAYNKWYMYGGGTFKKLYDTESGNVQKGKAMPHSTEPAESQGTQTSQPRESTSAVSSCPAACLPPAVDGLPAQTSSQVISSYVLLQSPPINQAAPTTQPGQARPNTAPSSDVTNGTRSVRGTEEQSRGLERQLSGLVPSERKKQKTEDNCSVVTEKTGTLRRQQCTLTSGIRQSHLSESVNQSLQSVCGAVRPRLVLQNDKLNLHRQGSLNSRPPLNQRQHLFKRHSSPLFGPRESGTSGGPSAASFDSSAPHAEPSFMPMYQLKIPCITDGVSDSHLRHPPSPSQCSSRHQPPQLGPQETSPPPPPQSQSATPVPPPGQERRGSITKMTGTSAACKGRDANALGKAQIPHQHSGYTSIISEPQTKAANVLVQNQSTPYTMSVGPVSSVLSQPLKTFTPVGQNQSVTVSTTHSTVSMLSHSSTPTKTSQIYAVTMTTEVQTSSAASVVISKKPLDTHVSVCLSATDSAPLGITQSEVQGIGQAELQGSRFEDKMLLVNDSLQSLAQDTFYVRTADLQIVMQLISDEQLALIEPQIETQDYKLYGSHSLPQQNSETSQPVSIHASVSQDVHKQFSDHAMRKPCVSEADMNSSTVSNVLDTTPPSAAATEQNNSGESAKDTHCRRPENTKTGPRGVISNSCSKTVRYAPALRDGRTNASGQLYKSHKVGVAGKELESAGHGTTIRSYPKQSPAGTLGEVSDKPSANPGSGSQPGASPASRNLSVSTVREGEHVCGRSPDGPGAVHTPEAALSRPAGSTQRTPMSLKEKGPLWPDGPVLSDTCQQEDCQPVLTTTGQHKSCQLLAGTRKSVEGETAEIMAEETSVPPASISLLQKEPLSAIQPSQLQPCRLACPTPATDRKNGSRSASDPTLGQRQPFNQSGAHGGGESKVQENESCGPGQASGHLPQQDSCTQRPDIMCEQKEVPTNRTALVTSAQFSSHRPASQEERVVCGAPSGGMDRADQDPCTGPWLGGSLQSSQLHWEAGTEFQGWAPQEPKNTEEEEKKREGIAGTSEGTQTAVNLHLPLSQPVTNVCPNTHYNTPALCGVTSLSHAIPALCQRECVSHISSEHVQVSSSVSEKAVQDLISPGAVKGCDRVPSGTHKRFTSLPAGHLHLANEQSSSENAILKEVQKETHVKNSATQSHSKSSRLSQHKRDGAAEFRESTEPCATLSPCTTAACGATNTTSANPDAPYPNLTNSYAIHYKQTCVTTTHSNSTEPASQCHAGGSYLEEERTSSSSDDEGKLVIELE